MIITIEGKPNEGKSRLAEKICKGKKSFLIDEDELSSSFWNHPMDKDTDIIIVDDVRNFENTYTKFRYEFLTINRRFKEQFKIKMPDIILIKFSLNRYECPQCNIILERESNKKWIKSYCSESGKDVRLQLISKVHNNMHGFLLDFIIATKEQMHSKKVVTLGEFIIEFISNNSVQNTLLESVYKKTKKE